MDNCGRRPFRCGRRPLRRWTTCGDKPAAHRTRDLPTAGPPVRPHAVLSPDLHRHRFSTCSTTPTTMTKEFYDRKIHTPSSGSGGRASPCRGRPLRARARRHEQQRRRTTSRRPRQRPSSSSRTAPRVGFMHDTCAQALWTCCAPSPGTDGRAPVTDRRPRREASGPRAGPCAEALRVGTCEDRVRSWTLGREGVG